MFTLVFMTERLMWQVAPTVPQVVWHSLIHQACRGSQGPHKGSSHRHREAGSSIEKLDEEVQAKSCFATKRHQEHVEIIECQQEVEAASS